MQPSFGSDRRVRSEDHNFGLTFAAELPNDTSKYGHAFIIWQHEDDAKMMSIAEAIGFYPKGDPPDIEVLLGTAGQLDKDFGTPADLKLTVLLNSDLYQRALSRKAGWQTNGRYAFLWSNCTTHVADIADAIGLTTSKGTWETPQSYVQDLFDRND